MIIGVDAEAIGEVGRQKIDPVVDHVKCGIVGDEGEIEIAQDDEIVDWKWASG